MKQTAIICDNCGKSTMHVKEGWGTPYRWFRLESMKLLYRTSKSAVYINKKNILEIGDPDFCSLKCLMTWFEKNAKKITLGK